MSGGLSISFDILEKIIDIIAADDDENSTLVKPCALICRSLLHCSRTHIFRKITVGLPTNLTEKRPNLFWGMPSRLCRLISRTPELANYVRVLEIGIGAGEKYYAEGRRLSSTLRRFKHIESLMLSAQCPPRNSGIKLLNWKNVSLPLQQAILSLMQLQTLKGLNLWKMIFPIFQMKIGGNVRSLRMADVNFYALDDDGPRTWPKYPSAVQPIQLHEYGMSNDGGAQSKKLLKATRSDGRPVFDFGHLRSLTAELYFLPRDLDVVQDIINKTTHLTTLFLTSEVIPAKSLASKADIQFIYNHSQMLQWYMGPGRVFRRATRYGPQNTEDNKNTARYIPRMVRLAHVRTH